MTTIVRATPDDAKLLSSLGRTCFLESHGLSAPKEDIEAYLDLKFTENILYNELQDSENYFFILNHNGKSVGYSKTIYNCSHHNISLKNVTKLERLYVLKEFYNLKMGLKLFNFNLKESTRNGQTGMWLFVWEQNLRAFGFYEKAGFRVIENHDFKISEKHSNPNYQMLLTY